MNGLITIENGVALLNPETASKIAEFEKKAKEIKEAEDKLRTMILEEMESKDIKSVSTDELTITYKAPYDRETIDTKTFKKDFPGMLDDYTKMSTCKASLLIKVKE